MRRSACACRSKDVLPIPVKNDEHEFSIAVKVPFDYDTPIGPWDGRWDAISEWRKVVKSASRARGELQPASCGWSFLVLLLLIVQIPPLLLPTRAVRVSKDHGNRT